MTRLAKILYNADACGTGAAPFNKLTFKAAFKRARYVHLRWYVHNVLQDSATVRAAFALRYGITHDAFGNRQPGQDKPANPRAATRLLRDRIRQAHPSLRNVKIGR